MKKTGRPKTTKPGKKSSPMTNKEDVKENPDMHIDQDFPGYPHHPSREEAIKPETNNQQKTSGLSPKTGKA